MTCLQFLFISLPALQHCVPVFVCMCTASGLCESDLPKPVTLEVVGACDEIVTLVTM